MADTHHVGAGRAAGDGALIQFGGCGPDSAAGLGSVGLRTGALTVGSALPHLLRVLGSLADFEWRIVVGLPSAVGAAGGLLVLFGGAPGPYEAPAARFSAAVAIRALREPAVRLANLGYLGHMWELYAMWTWIPIFLSASFAAAGSPDPATSSLAAFAVVVVGGFGCLAAGILADRLGRTTLTFVAMAVSGTSALGDVGDMPCVGNNRCC